MEEWEPALQISLPEHTFRCPKGHTWKGPEGSQRISLRQGDWIGDIDICFQCMAEFIEANFPAEQEQKKASG